MSVPTTVAAGEKFSWREPNGKRVEVVALPPCESKTGGRWTCMTHNENFDNQMQKDCHLDESGRHKLGWICFEHGLEQP